MITRAQIRRQLRAQGGITNTVPREGFFLGGIKKRLRKLIPNELANFAVKAAPFVAPFQPGIAAAMRGIGRFDQRGSVSDALKQGIMTYGAGEGIRRLGGLEGFTSGNQYSMDKFKKGPVGRLFKGTETNIDGAKKTVDIPGTPGTKGTGLKSIKDATSIFKDVPILKELPNMVQQQILVGGATAAGTYLYNAFLAEEPPQEEGETMEEYMARRKENVGNKMRTYFDNYFKFDKEYSSMTDEQKDAFVARYNMASGGRVGYQTGGISMGNTLAQNIAANRAQAAGIQTMLQAARNKLSGAAPQAAPAGITSVPTEQAMPTTMRANIEDLTRSFDPAGRSDARDSLFGRPPSGGQTISPNRKPIDYSKFIQTPGAPPRMPGMGGMDQEDFMKLSEAEQMKRMDADVAREEAEMKKYGSFADGRTIDPRTVGRSAYNDLLNVFKFDFPQVQLTGNETLAELDTMANKLYGYKNGGRIGYAGGSKPSFKQWVKMQGADIDTLSGNEYVVMLRNYEKEYPEENRAQGGRIGYAMGTGLPGIPTGDMRRNRMGVIERDYRDEGGFVPVGVKEKADDVPAMLSKNEFVMTADAVRGAGDGNINKGAQRMYDLMKQNESKVV